MKKKILFMTIANVLMFIFLILVQGYAYIPATENIFLTQSDAGGQTYQIQIVEGHTYLYTLTEDGSVGEICGFEKISEIKDMIPAAMCVDDLVYVLCVQNQEYKILSLDSNLVVQSIFVCPGFQEDRLGSMQVMDGTIYLTFLKNDNTVATTYSMAPGTDEFKPLDTCEAPGERHFVKAFYEAGQMTALYDDGTKDAAVSESGQAVLPADRMKAAARMSLFGATQLMDLIARLGLILFVDVCLFLLLFIRRDACIRFARVELLLLAVLAGSGIVTQRMELEQARKNKIMYAVNQVSSIINETGAGRQEILPQEPGFMESEEYQTLYQDLMRCMVGNESMLASVKLVNQSSGMRFTQTAGCDAVNGSDLEELYDEKTTQLLAKVYESGVSATEITMIQGQNLGMAVFQLGSTLTTKNLILIVVPLNELLQQQEEKDSRLFIRWFLLALAATAVLLLLVLADDRRLKKLVLAMDDVGRGESRTLMKPRTGSKEYDLMWNSLNEIARNKEQIFYSRNKIKKAYDRFAPRNIERLLNKESISEVAVGDVVQMEGTIGTIELRTNKQLSQRSYMEQANLNFETICRQQMEHGGVLLSNSCNLRSMKVLFTENVETAVLFGIDTVRSMDEANQLRDQDMVLLFHFARLMYGVAGTRQQSFPFLVSTETDKIQQYTELLLDLRVKVAVSEQVVRYLSPKLPKRYIGYITIEGESEPVRLYEMLDACREEERSMKIALNDKFQNAMELYYKKDFYLARNMFTEIIKVCPKDAVAKWYIFSCEKILGDESAEEADFGFWI